MKNQGLQCYHISSEQSLTIPIGIATVSMYYLFTLVHHTYQTKNQMATPAFFPMPKIPLLYYYNILINIKQYTPNNNNTIP